MFLHIEIISLWIKTIANFSQFLKSHVSGNCSNISSVICLDLYRERMARKASNNSQGVKRKMADYFLWDFSWKHY